MNRSEIEHMPAEQFDAITLIAEKRAHDTNFACNEAFEAAMHRAIQRGREKVRPGTFVDSSPVSARRMHGDIRMSACGSPAALCSDIGSTRAHRE